MEVTQDIRCFFLPPCLKDSSILMLDLAVLNPGAPKQHQLLRFWSPCMPRLHPAVSDGPPRGHHCSDSGHSAWVGRSLLRMILCSRAATSAVSLDPASPNTDVSPPCQSVTPSDGGRCRVEACPFRDVSSSGPGAWEDSKSSPVAISMMTKHTWVLSTASEHRDVRNTLVILCCAFVSMSSCSVLLLLLILPCPSHPPPPPSPPVRSWLVWWRVGQRSFSVCSFCSWGGAASHRRSFSGCSGQCADASFRSAC